MKAVRVTTLGCEIILVFLPEMNPEGVVPSELRKSKKHALVLPDIRYTMSLLHCDSGRMSPELLRSIQVYLGALSGFPSGEYDLLINGKEFALRLEEQNRRIFGGNVGKCKQLSSNIPLESKVYPISFSEIVCGERVFRVSVCENISDFDIASVGAAVLRQTTEHEPPYGFIVLPNRAQEQSLGFFSFGGGVCVPSSEALCAAGFFLAPKDKGGSVRFRVGGDFALVGIDPLGFASLYCVDFSFQRMNFL